MVNDLRSELLLHVGRSRRSLWTALPNIRYLWHTHQFEVTAAVAGVSGRLPAPCHMLYSSTWYSIIIYEVCCRYQVQAVRCLSIICHTPLCRLSEVGHSSTVFRNKKFVGIGVRLILGIYFVRSTYIQQYSNIIYEVIFILCDAMFDGRGGTSSTWLRFDIWNSWGGWYLTYLCDLMVHSSSMGTHIKLRVPSVVRYLCYTVAYITFSCRSLGGQQPRTQQIAGRS